MESIKRCSVSCKSTNMTSLHIVLPLYMYMYIQTRHGSSKEVVVAMQAKKDVGYQNVVVGGKVQRVPIQVTCYVVTLHKREHNKVESLICS